MSEESIDEFKQLFRLKQPSNPWFLFCYIVASEIYSGEKLNPNDPIANLIFIGSFETYKEFSSRAIEYGKVFKTLNFSICQAMKPFPIQLVLDREDTLELSGQEWDKLSLDHIAAIDNQRLKFQQRQKINEEIEKEQNLAKDQDSLEYLRDNFSMTVKNRSLVTNNLDISSQAWNAYLKRRQNCLEHIRSLPEHLNQLSELYLKRLPERGEEKLSQYLLSHLKDVDAEGIPVILSTPVAPDVSEFVLPVIVEASSSGVETPPVVEETPSVVEDISSGVKTLLDDDSSEEIELVEVKEIPPPIDDDPKSVPELSKVELPAPKEQPAETLPVGPIRLRPRERGRRQISRK